MTQNSRLTTFLLAPVVALSCTTFAHADELGISASTPEVRISTRPTGRNFMRLPGLQYEFVAALRCADGLAPASLSLSIADTRVTRELDTNAGSQIALSVSVPAGQIGPIAVDSFCTTDAGRNDRPTLRIPAVLSAQAALLCVGESATELSIESPDETASEPVSAMTYASESLDVLLRCDIADEAETHSIRR